MYCKDKETQNPDSEDSINTLKDCLKYIFNFCNGEKITLAQYKNYTGILNTGAIPIVFTHLKNHKINFYVLHSLDMESIIKPWMQDETLNLIISDFYDLYRKTHAKFISSKSLKEKARKGLKIIEQKLLKFSA